MRNHPNTLIPFATYRTSGVGLFLLWLLTALDFSTIAAPVDLHPDSGGTMTPLGPRDATPPSLVFNSISVQLDATGSYTLSIQDIAAISAGTTDGCAITNMDVTPKSFTFCDVPSRNVTLTVRDSCGNVASRDGLIRVLRPTTMPNVVYVSATYPLTCGAVSFPNSAGTFYVGYNAFNTIQGGVDSVSSGGTVNVAPGTYVENVTIDQSLSLLGPNAGKAGVDPTRSAEAIVLPAINDPENTPIISVLTHHVRIDGFLLEGNNPALGAGYIGNEAQLYAAAGVQNGVYPDLSNVHNITIQDNIIQNISYDGVYLDRGDFYTSPSTDNFILNNLFRDMWEGLETYAIHTVIAGNTISNVNRGLSVHGTITAAGSFMPAVTNNNLIVAQWWPHEITRLRGIGIWINYRRENAAPLWVADNVIETPNSAPPNCTIRGLEALTLDGTATVTFARNIVHGDNNCHQGIYVNSCWTNNAVQVLGGSLNGTLTGALASTLDPDFGAGDAYVTLSNVSISVAGGGTGVLALQDDTTPNNHARLNLLANSVITGGLVGIAVQGTNATASILNNAAPITGNFYGVVVNNGRALIENNDLTGNSVAAIRVEGAGAVDAGDCGGADITGLATGSGPNGSSAGLNKLYAAGYPFAEGPIAIRNLGNVTVLAQSDDYGATSLDDIASVLSGPVSYSQRNAASVVAPAPYNVECVNQIPPGTTSLSEFFALGGFASANPATLSFSNYPANPMPGNQTVYRSYFVTDSCGRTASCIQTINVRKLTPPSVSCPGNIVQGVDPGHNYATVHFSIGVSDDCPGVALATNFNSGDHFPVGTNTVTAIAMDVSGLTATCSFTVSVIDVPAITSQPLSRTNNASTTATFQVGASSPAVLSYHWYKNGNPLSDIGNVSGSATSTLTLSGVWGPDSGNYTVVVTDLAGSTTSEAASLTVLDPAILAQPVEVTTPVGSPASFSLVAAGTPVLRYQWYFDNVAIPGATTSAYSIANTLDSDSGSYSVVVINVSGARTSAPAMLILTHPPVITQHPVNVTTDLGQSASFNVNVSGATPFGYVWQKNGNPIPGATARFFTIPAVQAGDSAAYNVVVTNLSGSETSHSALLSLITSQPQSLTQISNSTASFTVVVTGLPSTYQWKKNGSIIADATTTILRIPNIGAPDAAAYNVVINNSAGGATSANATLTVVAQPTLRLLGYSKFTHQPTLSVSGSGGFNYAIRASTNFVDWLNLVTNPVPYNYTDTSAMTLEHQFYQGFWVP